MFDDFLYRSPYVAIVSVYTLLFGLIGAPILWLMVGFVSGDWTVSIRFFAGMFGIGFVLGNLSYLFNERWS